MNNATRQLLKERYLALFGKTLEHDLKSEISGRFLDGVLALLEQHDIYEAKNLRNAIHVSTLCLPKNDWLKIFKKNAIKKIENRNRRKCRN